MLRLSYLRDPSTYCQRDVCADFFLRDLREDDANCANREEETHQIRPLALSRYNLYRVRVDLIYLVQREEEREKRKEKRK